MTEQQREQISALMDDEQGTDAVATIRHLQEDSELRNCWHRYHRIGDLLRGDSVAKQNSFADSIAAAIVLVKTPCHEGGKQQRG